MGWCSRIVRPFGIALGIAVLVNSALALHHGGHSITSLWLGLDPYLPEPLLSWFGAVLGFALIAPNSFAKFPSARWCLAGVLCGFGVLVAFNVADFYHALVEGHLQASLPIPFSLAALVVILGELVRILQWQRLPRVGRWDGWRLDLATTTAAFCLLNLVYVTVYGNIDFRRQADAAVVIGSVLERDGTPTRALRERLDTATTMYHSGLVAYLILSDDVEASEWRVAQAMADYAVARNVPPQNIILDGDGGTTLAAARSCRQICEEREFETILAVAPSSRCARLKLAFQRQGLRCFTVPTSDSPPPGVSLGVTVAPVASGIALAAGSPLVSPKDADPELTNPSPHSSSVADGGHRQIHVSATTLLEAVAFPLSWLLFL